MKKVVSICIAAAILSSALYAQKNSEEQEVDHLAIATMMVYDGKFDKADSELRQVDQNSPDFDAAKFYTIKAVIAMRKEQHEKAINTLKKAVEATKVKEFKDPNAVEEKRKYLFSVYSDDEAKNKPVSTFDPEKVRTEKLAQLYINLSQEYYKIQDYRNTVRYLDLAGPKGRENAGHYMLRSDCYWKLKEYDRSINFLTEGARRFPDDQTLLKQKFYYFAELKLYQQAVESAYLYMKRGKPNAGEHIALSQMLLSGGQREEALKVLEEAKLSFPDNAKINMLLGHIYMQKGMPFTTAGLFEVGSYYDAKYSKEAAELYRRVGNLPHAIYLNSQVNDKVEKLKQKIAIYVDRQEYEKIIGLKDALKRYNMLSDDNLRYALAYAYYMAKDYDAAEENLKKITDNELFSKATIIRKNIEKCKENSLECI
ncbi:MAG: hypothetical protein U9Q90_02905 [Campylobacterota bacterium]|nr:hypothetical protein [Campylobacterota bacterium]